MLASADEQGNIAVKDLRMLGGSTQQPPRGSASRGLPPPTSTLSTGQVSGSSWGAYSGNAAARGLVWEVRGAHQGQGVVRMVAGLRPLADGTTGWYFTHLPTCETSEITPQAFLSQQPSTKKT